MKFILTLIFSSLLLFEVFSRTAEEWKSRSVYQIITDRFARTNGDATPCSDLGKYCGGSFKGIQNNLDYIQGMGFDAIWISPVVANTPDGYHGYWTSNLYEINPYFGTPEELKELIKTCHERDMYVMVDIVANHMGYVDNFNYSSIVPFSDASHYNPYVDCAEFFETKDQDGIETCWLSGLPDLDQNNPFVKQTLIDWVREFVKTYNIDALRIDTVPHVSKTFWKEFGDAAGVFTMGEVLNFEMSYLASYQGSLDAVLNYALYSTLRYSFQNSGSMKSIEDYYANAYETWPDITTLGNFVNNHDNPRFLAHSEDIAAFKAALAFSISSVGIPMVYYGDEQAYRGGMDPANREDLWSNMKADSDIYNYLKTINLFRKKTEFYQHEQVQRYADDNVYAFTRGNSFFSFTNSQAYQSRVITYHPYSEGTILCNIFHKDDCVEVKNGEFPLVMINGEVKIFEPTEKGGEEPQKMNSWHEIKEFVSNSLFDNQKISA